MYVYTLGNGVVSWLSRLQKIVVLSTMETEYVAATKVWKEMVWRKNLFGEVRFEQKDCTLFSDSQSTMHLAKNMIFHVRMKHIDIIYHIIRTFLEKRQMSLEKVHTSVNHANMPMKIVPPYNAKLCATSIGLR